jgi:SAM-dependent methyltransferase
MRLLPMSEGYTAIRVGRVIAVAAASRRKVVRIAAGLSARGYTTTATPHFVVCRQQTGSGQAFILHTFDQRTIDEDLAGMIGEELGPILVATEQDFSDTLHAILGSACPDRSPLERWRRYGLNTLDRLRTLLDQESADAGTSSHIPQFAAIYRRVLRHLVGKSLLDAGTSLGFLPILAAERWPGSRVVGCDARQEVITCARDLARAARAHGVRFLVRDVLESNLHRLGGFDTVTAVHLLEHLDEGRMLTATANLLRVAARRLIVAVPYESRPQLHYGHVLVFTPERLQRLGEWCLERNGGGRFWCEEVSGGLLIVDHN